MLDLLRGCVLAMLLIDGGLASRTNRASPSSGLPSPIATPVHLHHHDPHLRHHWTYTPVPWHVPRRSCNPIPVSTPVVSVSVTTRSSTPLPHGTTTTAFVSSQPNTSIPQVTTAPAPSVTSQSTNSDEQTTSTVFTTRTSTITACPSTVHNCPASQKTTYVTTETLVVTTTICPVSAGSVPTGHATKPGNGPSVTTSTILSTRTTTASASRGPYVTTETLVVGTSVFTVYPQPTAVTHASGSESIGTNLSGSGSGSSGFGSLGASSANGAVSGLNNGVSPVHTALVSSPTCHGSNCMGSPGPSTPLPSSSMTTVRGQSVTSIPYTSLATGTTTSPSTGSTATPLFNGAISSSGLSLVQLMSLVMTAFIALIV